MNASPAINATAPSLTIRLKKFQKTSPQPRNGKYSTTGKPKMSPNTLPMATKVIAMESVIQNWPSTLRRYISRTSCQPKKKLSRTIRQGVPWTLVAEEVTGQKISVLRCVLLPRRASPEQVASGAAERPPQSPFGEMREPKLPEQPDALCTACSGRQRARERSP